MLKTIIMEAIRSKNSMVARTGNAAEKLFCNNILVREKLES
jgi:hypothetical protein